MEFDILHLNLFSTNIIFYLIKNKFSEKIVSLIVLNLFLVICHDELGLKFIPAEAGGDCEIPIAGSNVSAGFPSPADDYLEQPLDLNKYLIRNPSSTFFVRVAGESMKDAGINDGDLLVVDKSVEVYDGCIAVSVIDGEFTLKRVRFEKNRIFLLPANEKYKPIEVSPDDEFRIWGIVRYSIKDLR